VRALAALTEFECQVADPGRLILTYLATALQIPPPHLCSRKNLATMGQTSLKITVVDGQTEKTIYLYDERPGLECSAEVAIRLPLPRFGTPDELGVSASKELRDFLERALAALGQEEFAQLAP
jgi:hypothetical protein